MIIDTKELRRAIAIHYGKKVLATESIKDDRRAINALTHIENLHLGDLETIEAIERLAKTFLADMGK